jgi:hypothetical protein
MALKKMRVSFDIDIPVFLSMLAAANTAMKIDVYGDERADKPPRAARLAGQGGQNGHAPKLLEGPRTVARGADANGKRMTAYQAILAFFVTHKDHGHKAVDIRPAVIAIGLNEKSVSPQLTKLRTDGMVKKEKDGLYHVTTRGIAHHEKMTAAAAVQQAAE